MLPILEVLAVNYRLKNVNLSWNFLVQMTKPPQGGMCIKEEELKLGKALPSEMIRVEPGKEKKRKVALSIEAGEGEVAAGEAGPE